MTAASSSSSNCQVVLTLAHLLQQHSLSYDDEKNTLLDTSVRRASHLAKHDGGSEVHIILTGSPRPTFAETNAWLLEGGSNSAANHHHRTPSSSPKKDNGGQAIVNNSNLNNNGAEEDNGRPAFLKGSYSIADNVHYSNDSSAIDGNIKENEEENNGQSNNLLQEYIDELANNSGKEGDEGSDNGHATSFIRRNTTGEATTKHDDNEESDESRHRRNSTTDAGETSVSNNTGPMVGQAVVNAISQSSGVGLQSDRSKLLQGTIDRPLWSQNRWTDGECLFSELVDMCGMKSFEMDRSRHQQQQQGGPDDAAGVAPLSPRDAPPPNMSANLITVPATTLREPNAGVSPTTIDEIARGILRTVKRKKSPPASKVHIVLPGTNNQGVVDEEEKRRVVVTLLKEAWGKLEQYNAMIGQPNLMCDADLEFVDM